MVDMEKLVEIIESMFQAGVYGWQYISFLTLLYGEKDHMYIHVCHVKFSV